MSRKGKTLKGPTVDNKLHQGSDELDYPVLCFKHLTTNKKYNIQRFKTPREKAKAYGALFFLIEDMQSHTWKELYTRAKKKGIESIPAGRIKFKPNNFNMTPDTKLLVLRFYRQKYRVIGMKSEVNNAVFHVLGFDFDYSAYDHG